MNHSFASKGKKIEGDKFFHLLPSGDLSQGVSERVSITNFSHVISVKGEDVKRDVSEGGKISVVYLHA